MWDCLREAGSGQKGAESLVHMQSVAEVVLEARLIRSLCLCVPGLLVVSHEQILNVFTVKGIHLCFVLLLFLVKFKSNQTSLKTKERVLFCLFYDISIGQVTGSLVSKKMKLVLA